MSDCIFHKHLEDCEFVEHSPQGKTFYKNKKNGDVEVYWYNGICPECGRSLIEEQKNKK